MNGFVCKWSYVIFYAKSAHIYQAVTSNMPSVRHSTPCLINCYDCPAVEKFTTSHYGVSTQKTNVFAMSAMVIVLLSSEPPEGLSTYPL